MTDAEVDSDSGPWEIRAKTLWEGAQRSNTIIRGFEVKADEPVAESGTNTAPAPAEIFLGSIGACLTNSFAQFAFASRLKIEAISVSLSGKIERLDKTNKITEIVASLKAISSTNSPEKLERCFKLAHENCLLLNSMECEKKLDFKYIIE